MNRFLAQAGTRIAHVHLGVSEIADVAIDIDGFGFSFHLSM